MDQFETLTERRADREIAPRPGISLHFLQDEGVLFDSARQELYGVNTAATFIWCCLCEGFGEEEIVRRFAVTFNLSAPRAGAHVARMIDHWRGLHLIGASAPGKLGADTEVLPPPEPIISTQVRDGTEDDMHDYVLLDMRFRLCISSRTLRRQACRLLAPFRARVDPTMPAIVVELVGQGCRHVVHVSGRELEQCNDRSQALPMLKACLLRLALQKSGDFAAIHAAAAVRRGRCIVMAAASGGGKSTLAAGLVARGFQLFSDDTVVLSNDDLSVRPLPFSICLKKEAWKLLDGRFPELKDQPVHDRPDGKKVRYLSVPRPTPYPAVTDSARVSAIVFLSRNSKQKAALVPLSATVTLRRLLNGFHPLGDGLDDAKVDRLLRWVSSTESFELRYSSLEEGVTRLEQICP